MIHLHLSVDTIASIVNTFIVLAVIIYYRHMRRVNTGKGVSSVVSRENQWENGVDHRWRQWNRTG